jgi:fructose-1,6-bisphosphatase/sedoheptulose 1,7-bisphosphatase-like protein
MKHLLLEIVETTEAAAIAASKYIGSGDKLKIDEVATNAMRDRLNNIDFVAEIAIGEGIKDESLGLYKGERVGGKWLRNDLIEQAEKIAGCAASWDYDIAVDPVDGTTQTAKGGYEAMSVIAVGSKGCLLPTPAYYMNKIAVGKHICDHTAINLKMPIKDIIESIRQVLNKNQITVCILDRPRHNALATKIRDCGCLIKFIQDCDVSGAIAAALPDSGIDLFVGIGGAPEGVISAAALKCLGGYFEGQIVDNTTYQPVEDTIYSMEMLAKGNVMFCATGILNGSLLKGIRHEGKGIITHSILMESATKSLKRVESYYEQ